MTGGPYPGSEVTPETREFYERWRETVWLPLWESLTLEQRSDLERWQTTNPLNASRFDLANEPRHGGAIALGHHHLDRLEAPA